MSDVFGRLVGEDPVTRAITAVPPELRTDDPCCRVEVQLPVEDRPRVEAVERRGSATNRTMHPNYKIVKI